MATSMKTEPLLEATGIAKRYGPVEALKDASLRVNPGEVVALMGANGAGKSTFVKIITGAIAASGGEIRLRGKDTKPGSPARARRAGVIPVYQEPALIPDLTVAENLKLTQTEPKAFFHWGAELGISVVRPEDRIGDLPLATLRVLDLARALAHQPDVLLLDELTAALPTDLVERVLDVVRRQAAEGRGVIYISHRFNEIAALCHSCTILRDGRTVAELPVEPGVEDKVVEHMLGARIDLAKSRGDLACAGNLEGAENRLDVAGLSVAPKLEGISLSIRRGEVLGLVALEGQGQDELFRVLAGEIRPSSGEIRIDGQKVRFRDPADAIERGVKFVPGDRAHALLPERSVRENIALPFSAPLKRWGLLRMGLERKRVDMAIERLEIDTRAQSEVQRLSGGNQQKVTIGRWIATGVETLLLFDPTRGIDVRTKRQIYPLVRALAAEGTSVFFYTSELAEIPLVCDRVAAIFDGRLIDIIDAADASEDVLMRLAYGLAAAERQAS